jgi:hypothetical protein
MIALTSVLAGCGTLAASGAKSAGGGGGGGKAPAAPAKVSVTLSIVNDGAKAKHFVLHCDPVSGNVPDAASVCKSLIAMKRSPFAPPLKHMMCPMIMVSNHQIVVRGTWFGQKVFRVITDGGCDLAVFNSLNKTFH